MAEIVNLRQARKRRSREASKAEAAANRAQHGSSKVERLAVERERAEMNRTLDQARREGSDEDA